MHCKQIILSRHAVQRMFTRGISVSEMAFGQQNEEAMKCVICKHGNTEPGYATVTLERGDTVSVIRDVPAQICSECGEYYLDTATSTHVMVLGEEAVQRHAEVEVLRYVA